MAATYEPIASQTLGSDTSSVSFTSIAANWTDLVLIASVRSDRSGSISDGVGLTFNSDTGSNYSYTLLQGNGSTASSSRVANDSELFGPLATAASSPANTFAANVIHIQSYSNPNVYKTVLCSIAHDALAARRTVGLWRSTSAITAIVIEPSIGTNWKSGSTFSLFGIKAA